VFRRKIYTHHYCINPTMSEEVRVLHIDDEPDFADMTATFLERENDRFEIETATDADEGLEYLNKNEYDCVVSDYDMPGKDGIEFLRMVREEYPAFPFILFTGKGSEEVASEAISAGVTDYLQKESGTEQYELLANRIENVVTQSRAEQKLKKEQAFIEQAIDTLDDILYVIDTDGSLRRWNSRLSEVTGYTDAELSEMKTYELFPEEHRESAFSVAEEALSAGQATFEVEMLTSDGDRIPYEFTGARLTDAEGRLMGIVGIGRDITERKERERDLRRTQERLNLAVEGAGLGVWDWDIESGEINHNEQWAEMLGMPPEEGVVSIESVRDRFHPKDLPESEEKTQEVLEGKKSRYDKEIRRETTDGEWIWIRTVGRVAERDEDGQPTRAVGVNIDIDERKKQKEELERYKTFVESSSDLITHMDADGTVLYQSPAAKEVFGYEQEDLVGDNAFEYVHPDDRERAAEEFYAIIENSAKDSGKVEYRALGADGEYIWTESVGKDQRNTEAGGVVINQRDISERKKKEKRLDEFASVVSHDLRNPLSVAKGRLELAQEDCDSEHLENVEDAVDRMDVLIDDILTLAREGSDVGEMKTVETEKIIEDCWSNVETGNATLVTQLERDVEADPRRLKQLCENLVRNAVEHGSTRSRTEYDEAVGHGDENVTVTVGELDEGDGFYVADDGDGVPEEKHDEIFETDYSTSEQGTGFGLRIVEGIVEAHGWDIEVTESQDGGARFEINTGDS